MAPVQPPSPPQCISLVTQDVNYYGDNTAIFPELMAACDSIVSVDANAQQLPQCP